ncbi:NRAMP family divalent metal transporter [Microbacterium sp.]|uniref:NRAMP family divalent metal transporter n=1 Tax=Microbacterium sp. TaxID=51671 RepID=UPI002620977C|nr:NRAMP family divalent metal transporter [Microbacterium sp.]MCV0335787.1 divalent metal cation transporter [Microbacterium sp.]MCV0377240.1 divalent metal cation transporter [Microbacterium sp.]MCV0391582.1 divalent metal cation transporter [Microbacterium sp.]MCV0419917.1 divalent metal cation transporter [Microbacterium sp.]MCV0423641.1 divalent metal cation transporter [Microbacterium sp.]
MSEQTTASLSPEDEARLSSAKKRAGRSAVIGAIFLMATSAIGPGFITQTATFTATMGAAFAFAILISILVDIAVQLNVWRMITSSGKRAGELANSAIPFSGHLIAVLVVIGGLAFNIGNIAGGGLGLNALLGIDPKLGGMVTAALAIIIFLVKKAGPVMDIVLVVLGIAMIVMTVIVAVIAQPPIGEALRQTFVPDELNFATITTIVGGTVGGYITYSGAHRYLDSGHTGPEHAGPVMRAATNGILVTGVMRYVLFLAILGVVASGVTLDLSGQGANPAGQAFGAVLGDAGLRIFGAIFWAAAISSVIGAAYTSATFLSTFTAKLKGGWPLQLATVAFIVVSLAVYLSIGTAPAAILVFVGGFNGLILPIGLTVFMYIGWFRRDLLGSRKYPMWLLVAGTLVTLLTWYMGIVSVGPIFAFLGIGA